MSDRKYTCPVCGYPNLWEHYGRKNPGKLVGHNRWDPVARREVDESVTPENGKWGGNCPGSRLQVTDLEVTLEKCQSRLDHLLALLEQP